ncbi:MAG: hypothetical protein AAF242_09525 [Bacteroidota bacterium]
MQVKKIKAYMDGYREFLQNEDLVDKRMYIWESQKIFQENWDLEARDLQKMFNQSLQNSKTRRLWSRESYAPKVMMRHFAGLQPDFFRQMFLDLFNEEKSAEGRIGRFVFYCHEMLNAYLEKTPKSRERQHYHDDGYQMISIYLTFKYPMQYIPYRLDIFQNVLQKIGALDPPLTHDTERYFKVAQTLYKMLLKEEDIMEMHQARLLPMHYQEETLLLAYDFMYSIFKNNEEV